MHLGPPIHRYQMARCGLPSMEVHFLVDPHVVQATLQLSEAWLPSMLRGVRPLTLPHPYKVDATRTAGNLPAEPMKVYRVDRARSLNPTQSYHTSGTRPLGKHDPEATFVGETNILRPNMKMTSPASAYS